MVDQSSEPFSNMESFGLGPPKGREGSRQAANGCFQLASGLRSKNHQVSHQMVTYKSRSGPKQLGDSPQWSTILKNGSPFCRMVDRSEKKHNHSAEQSTIPQNGSSKYPSAERHTHSAEWSIHHLGANIYINTTTVTATTQSHPEARDREL